MDDDRAELPFVFVLKEEENNDDPGVTVCCGWIPPAGDAESLTASFDAGGTGGKESTIAVPNDDEGLNGFNPANPVICDFNGAGGDAADVAEKAAGLKDGVGPDDVDDTDVAPVCWLDKPDEKSEDPFELDATDGVMVCWG